jgi:hypothetical protein
MIFAALIIILAIIAAVITVRRLARRISGMGEFDDWY